MYTMGKNNPAISMDNQGRLMWCRRQEIWLSQPLLEDRVYKGNEIPMNNKEISLISVI